MVTWRDELQSVIKSQAERDAEAAERKRQRLVEALAVAEQALAGAREGMRYIDEQLRKKGQPCSLSDQADTLLFKMHDYTLEVKLDRDTAILSICYNAAQPRIFNFVEERHTAAKDVEEYVGRRAVELARAAQKSHPW